MSAQESSVRTHPGMEGFSLVELLVTVVVFTLMMTAFFVFYRSQTMALSNQERFLNAKQNAQIGLDFMMRELRTAGSRPMPESFSSCGVPVSSAAICFGINQLKGFPSLVSANATSLRLLSDYRGNNPGDAPDGCPNDPGEDITYAYDAGTGRLLRTDGTSAATPVLEGIASGGLTFQYFGYGTGSPPPYVPFTGTLTADQIARLTHVVITVTISAPSRIPNAPAIVSTQTSTIDMRNPAC
jgi:type II secretory pathway pseudopilin PulG